MQIASGIAALVIFIVGIFMFGRSIKTGNIFDCLEGSKTEQTWITREDNPRRFWMTFFFYLVFFMTLTISLAHVYITGGLSS